MPNSLDIRALSVQAPWWWYIVHDHKGIENRSRRFNYRGVLLIHASKFGKTETVIRDLDTASIMSRADNTRKAGRRALPVARPHLQYLRENSGCIVGQVTVIGCKEESKSPWFVGPYGLLLTDAIAYPNPVFCKGSLGLWKVPSEIRAQLPIEGEA